MSKNYYQHLLIVKTVLWLFLKYIAINFDFNFPASIN